MDRESIEFWNGALKCAMKMERNINECKTLDQARKEIAYLKQRIENVHTNNFDKALEWLGPEKVME
jgi:Mn-containing catalase